MNNREAIEELKEMYEDGCYIEESFEAVAKEQALYRAIKALEEQEKHRWIPVSEKEPEIRWDIKMSEDVLVTVKRANGTCVQVSRTNGYEWFDVGIGDVIAWQPLPEPYEGE